MLRDEMLLYVTCRYCVPKSGERKVIVLPDTDADKYFPMFRFTGPLGLIVGNSVEISNPVNMEFDFYILRNKFADSMTKTIRSAKTKRVSLFIESSYNYNSNSGNCIPFE